MFKSYLKVFILTACLVGTGACSTERRTETDIFETAEHSYRDGDYHRALDHYESFLKLFPKSPLAEVAEQRIRTIKREVSSIMGKKHTPSPVWSGEQEEQ